MKTVMLAMPAPSARATEGGVNRGATTGAGEPMSEQRTPLGPLGIACDDDFTAAYYEGGRFRLCLDTSDPGKIPGFRKAIDCIEAILKLPKPGDENERP
jgi:hypothetical protein